MTIDKIRAQLISTIWQAVAQSGVDLSTISQEDQEKLVRGIADRVMVTMNSVLDEVVLPEAQVPPAAKGQISQAEPGDEHDEVVIWDPSQCQFNIPADILPGMHGTAIKMAWSTATAETGTGTVSTVGVPGISQCVDDLGSGTGWVSGECWWMVQTLCCGEDVYYA